MMRLQLRARPRSMALCFWMSLSFLILLGCSSSQKGLELSQLHLTTVTVFGRWVEDDSPLPYGQQRNGWTGSGLVAEVKDGTIRCLTNAHCLGLDELAVADSLIDGIPDIVSYQLEVVFSNGKKAKVARMAEEKRGLDLAWLEVPEEGLTEGRDFLIVPQAKTQKLEIGNTVVAVGAPLGLKGSYTFGRVSALRTGNGGAFGRQWIQHDAAINPGNSGGPLFCETKAGYFCIGINTAKIRGGENLGFAIPLDAAFNGTYIWASADAAGAVKLLAENYNTRAVIVPK